MKVPEEFSEIRPYEPEEMKQAFEDLLNDRQLNVILKGFAPWLPKPIRNGLLRLAFTGVKTPLDFQKRFMKPIVKYIIRKYTDGCTFDDKGFTGPGSRELRYTFVSNHRDIVLDSAFLDVMLVDALSASQLMSRYIHFAVTKKNENIWISQREGRAKDSNDRTQDAVLKMLAMGGDLKELNIVPLTISYEYDPCDYLKAQEFQQKRDNPAFKKSRQDDLDNMKIGLFGYKGRVVYRPALPINTWIDELSDLPKAEFYKSLAERMDKEIHRGYQLYPCNYIALDELNGNSDHSSYYTDADKQRFEEYLSNQMAKINLPDKDEAFLRERMLTMYANPVKNKLAAG